ncbi:MAG TPA: hypothetical protein PLI31_02600 [Methanoregulaceae archaeon]|nr:hypothetical protein [Methanoregulaceae archaeon]
MPIACPPHGEARQTPLLIAISDTAVVPHTTVGLFPAGRQDRF